MRARLRLFHSRSQLRTSLAAGRCFGLRVFDLLFFFMFPLFLSRSIRMPSSSTRRRGSAKMFSRSIWFHQQPSLFVFFLALQSYRGLVFTSKPRTSGILSLRHSPSNQKGVCILRWSLLDCSTHATSTIGDKNARKVDSLCHVIRKDSDTHIFVVNCCTSQFTRLAGVSRASLVNKLHIHH